MFFWIQDPGFVVCSQDISKKLWTDFDETFRDDWSRAKDQSVRFWGRSGCFVDPGFRIQDLFVCSQDFSNSYERILMKLAGMIGHVPVTNRLDFGEDPDVFVDPG
jgi:hypothetical protein